MLFPKSKRPKLRTRYERQTNRDHEYLVTAAQVAPGPQTTLRESPKGIQPYRTIGQLPKLTERALTSAAGRAESNQDMQTAARRVAGKSPHTLDPGALGLAQQEALANKYGTTQPPLC